MTTASTSTKKRDTRRPSPDGGGRVATLYLAPFFVLFALVTIAPIIYSIKLSFFAEKHSGLGFGGVKTVFSGLGNYREVLQSGSFVSGFAHLALYCLLYIPVMLVGATVFALLVDATAARMRKTFQTLVFLPHAVPSVIAALIWSYLFAPGISPIVAALHSVGINVDLLSPHLVTGSIAGIGVWEWTGYNAIIIFTALQAVPHEILEAARVDGASELRATLSIKLPQVLPALAVALLFTIIGTLQLFTEPTIIAQSTSSVTSGWVPNMWAYNAAFNDHNLGQAAAASIIIALVAAGMSFTVTRLSMKVNES